MGNPVVKDIKHYRKTIIAKCKALRYLDDRPVFEEERRRVTAWYSPNHNHSLTYSLTHSCTLYFLTYLSTIINRANAYETGGIEAANEAERLEIQNIRKEKDEAGM